MGLEDVRARAETCTQCTVLLLFGLHNGVISKTVKMRGQSLSLEKRQFYSFFFHSVNHFISKWEQHFPSPSLCLPMCKMRRWQLHVSHAGLEILQRISDPKNSPLFCADLYPSFVFGFFSSFFT